MPRIALTTAALVLVVAGTASAQAFIQYVSQQDGFGVSFPGEPTVQSTTWTSEHGVPLPARVYTVDNKRGTYTMTVVDYTGIEKLGIERAKTCPPGNAQCRQNTGIMGPGYWKHDARAAVRLRAPEQRAHARGQLGHGEGLDHVVVGAQVEAPHPVLDGVARGQHQHRDRALGRPQAPQRLESVHLRQADVENHQVEALLGGGEHRLLAARSHVHRVTLGFQDPAQARRQGRVVFHDQQSHGE